jgi:hypothetical protein
MIRPTFYTVGANLDETTRLEDGIPEDDRGSLCHAVARLRAKRSKKELKKMKKKAAHFRKAFLGELASFAANVIHTTHVVTLRKLVVRERLKQTYQQLRSIFKPRLSHGLDRIDVPRTTIYAHPEFLSSRVEEVLVPHTTRNIRKHRLVMENVGAAWESIVRRKTRNDLKTASTIGPLTN